ncbi:T-complex protein 1 subunit theta [Wickerhamomyces ciferrii]|uniref:CCT-theta n=1 Tax=Wickerhamomyces ciferrii (strain ATCC 14091 / BCRC 22168 / CBS 111 / JCM 3599 / NBRC 0793 / NRRL Y-1031 F-60-10) TaxID=1206466 RepID=K0KD82_WICCF|nr:T-complex protein 1 subunit theta [Wickerhamomyces ciferrii]CCH40856.1 T-complex protein 1 subunit theta [Wickerhamomyces ciferrii]
MSLRLPQAPNAGLFKQGYTSQSNADGAVNRNIAACREITNMVLSSIGPCDLQKVFITNDAATMLHELDVVHPAVKLLVMASEQQELEMGDGTNLVLVLAGEFLNVSEKLLTLGLNPTEIIQGYQLASKFALQTIEELSVGEIDDLLSVENLKKVIKPVIASKQYGSEDFISDLVSEAVLNVLPPKNTKQFNVDSVRVVKIMGSSLENSQVIKGMVFPNQPEGHIKNLKTRSKVVVFTSPFDISQTETKGTVLLHNAQEMLDFSKGEEAQLDQLVKEIYDSGVRVVIAGSGVGELAQHYLDRYGILTLKVSSKFDLRRICRVCGATPLPRLGAPMPEEMGDIDIIETKEIGGDRVTIFRQEDDITRTSTIVIRGATKNSLDDIERAIDDGVAAIKGLTQDGRLLPGAGAVEAELVHRITQYGERTPGLLQLAIKQYANAFEVIPRTLAETSGLDPTEVLPRLYSKHSTPEGLSFGIDIDGDSSNGVKDINDEGIYDLFSAKKFAIAAATEAATTVLSVDQIIMAKRAGGPQVPKQPRPGNWDQAD